MAPRAARGGRDGRRRRRPRHEESGDGRVGRGHETGPTLVSGAMADGVSVEVKGGRELRRKLRKAGDDLNDMKDIHRAAGEIVLAAADPPYLSGATAASMRVSATKTRAKVVAGSVGRSKQYAGGVHWGWPNKPNRTFGGPIPANKWLYEAMGRSGYRVASLYYDAVEDLTRRLNRSGTRGTF